MLHSQEAVEKKSQGHQTTQLLVTPLLRPSLVPVGCGLGPLPGSPRTSPTPWLISVFPSFQRPQYPQGCSLSLCSALTTPPGHTLRLDLSATPLPGSPGTVFLSQLSQSCIPAAPAFLNPCLGLLDSPCCQPSLPPASVLSLQHPL